MFWLVVAMLLGALVGAPPPVAAAESGVVVPAPAMNDAKAAGPLQTAVLAGGCFWGVQGVYEHVRGVRQVVSGYTGGDKATATYEAVSAGRTGHAESVRIRFDPKEISYGEILQIFFSVVHDPTQLDRQGPDSGPQYRSNVFYTGESQRNIAQAYVAQLGQAKVFGRAIVTRIDPLKVFYAAEEYHQDFLQRNPRHPYIVINDLPKIDSLRTVFPSYYREPPITVKGH
jgi:peptide-methionine (S)-S-oxide reductase